MVWSRLPALGLGGAGYKNGLHHGFTANPAPCPPPLRGSFQWPPLTSSPNSPSHMQTYAHTHVRTHRTPPPPPSHLLELHHPRVPADLLVVEHLTQHILLRLGQLQRRAGHWEGQKKKGEVRAQADVASRK